MSGYIDRAVSALIRRGQTCRFVPTDSIKIADLQENDTTPHNEDISAFVPPNAIIILITPDRQSGIGYFKTAHNNHASYYTFIPTTMTALVSITGQNLKWRNSAANDDWDIYLLGYWVQGVE